MFDPGTILPNGREILEQVGQGAFGTILKCAFKGTVCVAKVAPLLSKSKALKLKVVNDGYIYWESNVLRQFIHPNIVKLLENKYYDFEKNRLIYLEYLHPYDRQISTEALGNQVCDALQFIHGRKYVHRDVKPDNIMIRPETNEAVLCDFGTCMLFKDYCGKFKETGGRVGTPSFMSPAVHKGKFVYPNDDMISLTFTIHSYEHRDDMPWLGGDQQGSEGDQDTSKFDEIDKLWRPKIVPLEKYMDDVEHFVTEFAKASAPKIDLYHSLLATGSEQLLSVIETNYLYSEDEYPQYFPCKETESPSPAVVILDQPESQLQADKSEKSAKIALCGAPKKKGGTCTRKVKLGEKCWQHS